MPLTHHPARKDVPGLTFIFSLPEPASSMADFKDSAPCSLWKPGQEAIRNQAGQPIRFADGTIAGRIVYEQGALVLPFGELKNECLLHANGVLRFGTVFEIRLALPMGLDDPQATFDHDLWRIGWVSHPAMEKTKEARGLRERFGYYLLAKRVAKTPLVLDKPEKAGESEQFIGAERGKWADRFKKYA